MKYNNIIIFSSIDWSDHWQIHHNLSSSFINNNCKILFVENTGIRSIKIKDKSRILKRLSYWYKSIGGFINIKKNLFILSPIIFPFPYSVFFKKINNYLISRSLNKWINFYSYPDLIISFLPTPLIHGLVDQLNSKLLIYYCVDNLSQGSIEANKIIKWEEKFFKKADLIFCTAENIKKRAERFNVNTHLIPAGTNFKILDNLELNKYVPKELRNNKKAIIGYIGAFSEVFDFVLIKKIIKIFPECKIVLIGPRYLNMDNIISKNNVIYIDKKSNKELPFYINQFDVAIIPYIKNEFTNSVYPSKFNEYLAVGSNIVSTDISEMISISNKSKNLLKVAKNHSEFIEHIKTYLKFGKKNNYTEKISYANSNTWDIRFNNIDKLIVKNLLNKKYNTKYNLVDNLKYTFKKIKYSIIKISSFIILMYLLVFHSSIFWFLGKSLIITEPPQKVDAIVVFSGNGENSYINLSYQKRTLDAINYYNKGYSDKIFVTSGRIQIFSEVELIKSILLNKGVDEKNIYVLEKYPSSTFENVTMVEEILRINNIKSFIFITAPYHRYRSNLIWKKNYPNYEIVNAPTFDQSKKSIKWNIKLNDIEIIVYEYLAIVHNFFKGRL